MILLLQELGSKLHLWQLVAEEVDPLLRITSIWDVSLGIGIVLFERSMGVHLVSSGESLVVAWESGGLLLLALVPVVGPVLGWTPLYLLLLLLLVRGVGTVSWGVVSVVVVVVIITVVVVVVVIVVVAFLLVTIVLLEVGWVSPVVVLLVLLAGLVIVTRPAVGLLGPTLAVRWTRSPSSTGLVVLALSRVVRWDVGAGGGRSVVGAVLRASSCPATVTVVSPVVAPVVTSVSMIVVVRSVFSRRRIFHPEVSGRRRRHPHRGSSSGNPSGRTHSSERGRGEHGTGQVLYHDTAQVPEVVHSSRIPITDVEEREAGSTLPQFKLEQFPVEEIAYEAEPPVDGVVAGVVSQQDRLYSTNKDVGQGTAARRQPAWSYFVEMRGTKVELWRERGCQEGVQLVFPEHFVARSQHVA